METILSLIEIILGLFKLKKEEDRQRIIAKIEKFMKTVFDYIAVGFRAVFQFIPYFKPTLTAEILPNKNFTRLETSLTDPAVFRITYRSRFFDYPFNTLKSTAVVQTVQIKDDLDRSWNVLFHQPIEKVGEYVKATGNTTYEIRLPRRLADNDVFFIAVGNKGRTMLTLRGSKWLRNIIIFHI